MSHSFAELLGYHDCGLQAILYLLENTDIELDSPVVAEIAKLLISKIARTSASDIASGTEDGFRSVVHPDPSQGTDLKTQGPRCSNDHADDGHPDDDHPDDIPPWSRGCTRCPSDGGSCVKCDEDGRPAEPTSPNRTTPEEEEEDDDDNLREFWQWLTRLASRHPEIARTLCEVAELIYEADEQ